MYATPNESCWLKIENNKIKIHKINLYHLRFAPSKSKYPFQYKIFNINFNVGT